MQAQFLESSSSSVLVHKNYEHIKMSNKSYRIKSSPAEVKEKEGGSGERGKGRRQGRGDGGIHGVCVGNNVCAVTIHGGPIDRSQPGIWSDINGLLPIRIQIYCCGTKALYQEEDDLLRLSFV